MTNQPLVTEHLHPPIFDPHRLLTRAALRLGLSLVAWAERAANRRRAALAHSAERLRHAAELEHQLDQLQLDRTKWLVHFRPRL